MVVQYEPPIHPGPLLSGSREAPGATASLVLGIISIVMNVPVIALILAIVGLQKAIEAKAACAARPGFYTNAGVAQAGYVLCIIGICVSSLSTLCGCGYFAIILIALIGAAAGAPSAPGL